RPSASTATPWRSAMPYPTTGGTGTEPITPRAQRSESSDNCNPFRGGSPMNEQREVVILSGVRTAIGDYGGSLKDIAPSDLAARVVRESVKRAKVDPQDVGHIVFGNVIHTEAKDMYLSRVAGIKGGLPQETPALT